MSGSFKVAKADSQECCPCWERSSLNPKSWDLTSKKVAELSGVVVAICSMAILVLALLHQYPSAYGGILATCGISGTAALISMIVAVSKHCQEQSRPGIQVKVNL